MPGSALKRRVSSLCFVVRADEKLTAFDEFELATTELQLL